MNNFFTLIGLLGVATTLLAYGLMTAGRIRSSEPRYQIMNIVGTTGILLSFLAEWNFPSFVTNVIWVSIGIVGLVRIYRLRRN
ncbi:MAG: hypothetical protein SFW64_04375 [Alphaproteobacteria bacterium]|nr:hypothetical protein [Alphaproteobacteria bacterium]